MSILTDLGTPIFYAEGEPKGITRENYELRVYGMVESAPLTFTFSQLENMPFTTANARLTSVSGWSVRAGWQGVKFRDFLKNIQLQQGASYVIFESFGGYTTCVPLKDLQNDNHLICFKVEDEYLESEYGGPVRMVIPHLWGYKSIKGLSRMTFTDFPELGYWETRGYSDDAAIEPGFTKDVNSGETRKIKGGEVMEF